MSLMTSQYSKIASAIAIDVEEFVDRTAALDVRRAFVADDVVADLAANANALRAFEQRRGLHGHVRFRRQRTGPDANASRKRAFASSCARAMRSRTRCTAIE